MENRIIAFIPARGGSKSIPLKNIKDFCGKPLIYWNLEALEDCENIDEIIVATDSEEIANCVSGFNFGKVNIYFRDEENAQDSSSTESVMLEYINKKHFNEDDIFILVQATSPLTTMNDYTEALAKYSSGKFASMLTGARIKNFFWNDQTNTSINYDYRHRPRRQDFQGVIQENGAFYINRISNIKKDRNRLSEPIGIYEMPEYTAFEIDEPDDWGICESFMQRYILNKKKRKQIKLFLTDVDGVLTDAGMYYSEKGDELKKFNTHDGMGIELLRKAGIKTGIITSENSVIVKNRARKLKVDYLYQGIKDKIKIVKEICHIENIELEEVAYIGDDLNDLEVLKNVGLAATPFNGINKIKEIPGIISLKLSGGSGAVREFVSNYILV